jgi:uncharacterized protein YcfL
MKFKNFIAFNFKLTVAVIATVIIVVGCNSTPSIDDMTVRMRETDDVKILDMRSILVNNQIKVDATIQVKSSAKNISYRFAWYDKNKFQVYGSEAWKPLTIGSGQTGVVQSFAPGPAAASFKLELTSD